MVCWNKKKHTTNVVWNLAPKELREITNHSSHCGRLFCRQEFSSQELESFQTIKKEITPWGGRIHSSIVWNDSKGLNSCLHKLSLLDNWRNKLQSIYKIVRLHTCTNRWMNVHVHKTVHICDSPTTFWIYRWELLLLLLLLLTTSKTTTTIITITIIIITIIHVTESRRCRLRNVLADFVPLYSHDIYNVCVLCSTTITTTTIIIIIIIIIIIKRLRNMYNNNNNNNNNINNKTSAYYIQEQQQQQ